MLSDDGKREDLRVEPEKDVERGVRQRLEALIPDLVKKTVVAGIGAVFTTEEGIRKLASELTLPKDVANYLITGAQSTKDEVLRIFAREVREFLERVNLGDELAKLLTSLSLEIKTEIRFSPAKDAKAGVTPHVKRKVAVRRVRQEDEPAADDTDS